VTLEEWIREARTFDDCEFFGPVDDSRIEGASRDVGLPFPGQYRQFLSAVGCGSVATESFIGLGGPQSLDVVWMSRTLRAKKRKKRFPSTLIPLRTDGYGNYDAIDTTQPTEEGEYAVVEWGHEGSNADTNRILARSFLEWAESMLDLIREAD
jgi:cell wall assembly regulator SMI1